MSSAAPLLVHGSSISYFTGKLEAYLRYKEIALMRLMDKKDPSYRL